MYLPPLIIAVLFAFLAMRWMLPMRAVRLQLGVLLAQDATTLAPASANNVLVPIVAPFTAVETLVVGDLTLGSTNGLGPINCLAGNQDTGIDPVSQAQIITIIPGSGTTFRWLTSGSFAGPITVYGYALLTNASAVLLAVQALPTPITFTEPGYQLDVDPVTFTAVLQPLS